MKSDPRVPVDLFVRYGFAPDQFFKSDHKSVRGPGPKCGGTRRMLVFVDHGPNCNFECPCGYKGVMFANGNGRADPEATRKLRESIRQAKEQQKHKSEAALAAFRHRETWLEYHQNLDVQHRIWWLRQGIPPKWQNFYKLGYAPDKTFGNNGELFRSAAYTIPCFDLGWAPVNLQYRVLQMPDGAGKYRQEAGLPASLFFSRPDLPIGEQPIIVEGAKKAGVLCIRLPGNPQVIGLPGALSWAGVEERVRDCGQVWIVLDPDAQQAAHKLAEAIGRAARIVQLGVKPDDAFVQYGATPQTFRHAFHRAMRV